MKTKLIAATAVLVAATAGIALVNTSSAQPYLKLYFECFTGFKKSGETNNYACSKNFFVVCKQGFQSTNPVLTHLGGTKWKVSYGCFKPPA